MLTEHSGVRRAAVVPRKTSAGETRLAAYVVPEAGHQIQDLAGELARHLAERLPSYMVVASFVRVDELPLKPNGKLDVAALPSPNAQVATAAPTPAPRPASSAVSGTDDAVLAVMGELLSQPVSRHDNLYALGADSLALVRLVARLKSRMGLDLSIGEVMQRGDVADVLQLVSRQHRPATEAGSGPQQSVLCSPWQTWFWRLQQLDPTDATAVVFRAYRVFAPLDANLLEQALRALLGRHQALRCRLVGAADAEPGLELRPEEELILLRAKPLTAARLDKARRGERNRPFDLRRELPLRVTLQPDADRPGESELWLAVHHSAYDGSSEEIFWRELPLIYQESRKWNACTRGFGAVGGDVFRTGRETTCGIRPRDHAGARGLLAAAARRRARVSCELALRRPTRSERVRPATCAGAFLSSSRRGCGNAAANTTSAWRCSVSQPSRPCCGGGAERASSSLRSISPAAARNWSRTR